MYADANVVTYNAPVSRAGRNNRAQEKDAAHKIHLRGVFSHKTGSIAKRRLAGLHQLTAPASSSHSIRGSSRPNSSRISRLCWPSIGDGREGGPLTHNKLSRSSWGAGKTPTMVQGFGATECHCWVVPRKK